MTAKNAKPSRNPTNDDNLRGVLKVVLQEFMNDLDDMLPAQVVAFDRNTNLVQVKPLISMITTEDEVVERANIVSIPVKQIGGGGACLNVNLKPGDLGWIKANDRDISLYTQSFGLSQPNTGRRHSFSDSVFIPDFPTGFVIAPEDIDNLVLQRADSTVRLAIWQALLKITSPNTCITDIEGYTPSTHAVLDVQSTTRAFKPPRMTTGQKNAITAEEGMVVYDTTTHTLSVYNGSVWS